MYRAGTIVDNDGWVRADRDRGAVLRPVDNKAKSTQQNSQEQDGDDETAHGMPTSLNPVKLILIHALYPCFLVYCNRATVVLHKHDRLGRIADIGMNFAFCYRQSWKIRGDGAT